MSGDPQGNLLADLRDPDWRGPMQHLRSWSALDALHDQAADEIERLRAAHAENARLLSLVGSDLQGRIEAGKLAAIFQCVIRAQEAAHGE